MPRRTLRRTGRGADVVEVESGSTALNDGNPHHIVITWDGSASWPDIYVDGQLDTGTTGDGGNWNYADFQYGLYLAALNNRGALAGEYTGLLDEVTLYDRALTAAEVEEHYYKGLT